jgi:SAM-dependent methyltransferase
VRVDEKPLVWHFGLIARWWAEFNTDGPEIAYFRSFIDRYGQPALDAACGTGRLLLPYLREGLDVDGCDISADMLALCEERAKREGLTPRLYRQALHELDLPRSYKTIIVCGAFGLGGSRRHDQEALQRLHRHLQPGGALLLDSYLPYKDEEEWHYWTKEGRSELPQGWRTTGARRGTANGDELELQGRLVDLDPLDQVATRAIRATLWQDGKPVRQEEYTLLERLYFRNEVIDMLSRAGFGDILVLGDYTEDPAASDSGILVYVAGA